MQNNPVNWVDPYGLQAGAPSVPGVPGFPPILPPVFYPGTPENDAFVRDVNRILDFLVEQIRKPFLKSENDEPCEGGDSLDDYPANPDDWNPPNGWEETPAGENTGGKHRQWRGPDGQLRRWDREGPEGGKERGPHWHDPRYPGRHIPPNR